MEQFVELLKQVNIVQIFVIITSGWYFYNRLKNESNSKFDKIDHKFEKLEDRLTRLENDMIEVKTVLRLKECCMINDEKQIKKAE